MELKIYNQAGELKLTASTAASSTWNMELMKENAISVSFTHPVFMMLDVNDYVTIEGVKFSINKEYKPKQKSTLEYSYSVKFYGPEHDAERVMYLNLTDGQYNPQFSLDGGPLEHLQKWVDNMNRIYGKEMWSIGEVTVAENKTIEYNNLTCWDAIASIAEAFETEWWADGFTINLSRCERGERVDLGYQQGLTSLTQLENSSDVKFFTRLIPLGSTRNIDRNRYGFTRLQLPDRAKYVDRNTQYGLFEYVEEEAFSKIYPRYTGTVTSVRSEEKKGEDGKPFTVYYFKDSGMNFDPNEYEIGGLVKRISFQSGDLNGRGNSDDSSYWFEANYDSKEQEWEIVNTYPDEKTQIPGGNLIPRVGDTYIPWNFRMPEAYEKQAEKDYQAAVMDYLTKYSEDVSVYDGNTDYIYIDKNTVPLTIGQRVRLLSEEYFGEVGYRDSRITKSTRKLDNLSNATISCTNQVGKGWKSGIENSLNQLEYVIAKNKEQTQVDIIKVGESKEPSNYNVFSALKSLATFIRKDIADIVIGIITFLNGIKIGRFVSGMIGGFGASIFFDKNKKTVLEIDKVIAREELIVPKITFNCIDVISGDKANTFAFGTIKSVDKENLIAELDLLDDQLGTIHTGDICRGVFHSLEGGNQTEDSYDTNGYLNYAGFATSYFTPTDIIENELGVLRFRYNIQANTTVHPMPGMNFYAYGNFFDKQRQAITYENRYYTRRLKDVNTWVINPDKNIAMQNGLLEGLTIGGMVMHGHGTFMENSYLTGVHIQFTPEQKEEIKGEDAYSVNLSTYESTIVVDEDNNILGGLLSEKLVASGEKDVVSGERNVVASSGRLTTRIQAFKGTKELVYAAGYEKDAYMVNLNPVGCTASCHDGIVSVDSITDVDACHVDIIVNCEGNAVFEKRYKITALRNGSSVIYADLDNEMASVACDAAGNVLWGLPVSTKVFMWYGNEQLTIDKVELDLPAGVTATVDKSTVTVTGITRSADNNLNIGMTAYATFGGEQYRKKLNMLVVKVVPGENATIFFLQPSVNAIKVDKAGNYDVTMISCDVMMTDGTSSSICSDLPSGYRMEYITDEEAPVTYSCGASLLVRGIQKKMQFKLYKGDTLIDRETVFVISDGVDGEDGKDGLSVIFADLDNAVTSVACSDQGEVLFGLPVSTNVNMWYGTEALTIDELTVSAPAGVTCRTTGKEVQVTSIAAYVTDVINVIITAKATYKGFQYSRDLTFTINKVRKGENGENVVLYELMPSVNAVKVNKDNVYTPSSITCVIYKKDGASTEYLSSVPAGHELYYSINASQNIGLYRYGSDLDITTINDSVTFWLKKDGLTIDMETVPIVRDGVDGNDGQDGNDGKDGNDGTDGKDGQDGQDGQDGTFLKQIFIQSDSRPETPVGSVIPLDWSERHEFGELKVLGYEGDFYLEGGYRRSPKTTSHGSSYTDRIKFTTSIKNQKVTLKIDVSSEEGHDWAYIGNLDFPVSNGNHYDSQSGSKVVNVTQTVATPGEHYIEVLYKKDSSISIGLDAVKYSVVHSSIIWVSSAQATYDKTLQKWTYGTWSQPSIYLADTSDVEYVFRRAETDFIPESDVYLDDYIPLPFASSEDYRGDFVTTQIQVLNAIYRDSNRYYRCIKARTPGTGIEITNKEYFEYIIPFTDDPLGITEEYPVEYMSMRRKSNGKWGAFSQPTVHAKYSEGKPGADGASGSIYRRWKGYTTGKVYRNDDGVTDLAMLETDVIRYIDAVFIPNPAMATGYDCYIARKFEGMNYWVGTDETSPLNETFTGSLSPHWQRANNMAKILTDLIIAKDAVIDFMQGNKIQVMNQDGTVNACLGDGDTPIWVGAMNPEDAPFSVTKAGRVNATKGYIGGFEIDGCGLSNHDNKDAFIYVNTKNGTTKRLAALGNNIPAIAGFDTASMFEATGEGENIAIKTLASGSKESNFELGYQNIALLATGGVKWFPAKDDIWNMPGVLGIYEVNFRDMNLTRLFGSGIEFTSAPYKVNNSEMIFPHNLGHRNYTVLTNCWGKQVDYNINPYIGNLNDVSNNSFTLFFFRTGDGQRTYPLMAHIVIVGRNKS